MKDEIEILEIRFLDERASQRRREAFLISVVLHLILIIFILVSPRLFPRKETSERDGRSTKELGFLALPEDYQKLPQKPKAPVPADQDRIARGKAPKIDPKALRVPYSVGETKLPEQSAPPGIPGPQVPPPVAAAPEGKALPARQSPPPDGTKHIAKLQLPEAQPESKSGQSLRELSEGLRSPGFSIDRSIEKAIQSGNYGSGGPGGEAFRNFDNRQANFSVEEPTVLSDTHGVNFGSWLRLVYYRVRDNWYAVIPELIRSGTKGKVVVIFDVRNDGRIENLQVVRTSGLSPYDRAAVSSLKLSEPFPSFPPAFKGEFITLQFSYLYNMRL